MLTVDKNEGFKILITVKNSFDTKSFGEVILWRIT